MCSYWQVNCVLLCEVVLVSLDYRGEKKRHVIGTKVLPQVWKVYNLKMNKKLMQLHLLKRLSHTSVEDDQNQWTCLNTSALNSTAQHTHTVQWKTVNAAIGCGIQIGGNGLEHHVNISTK